MIEKTVGIFFVDGERNPDQWGICWTTFTASLSEGRILWNQYFGTLKPRNYLVLHWLALLLVKLRQEFQHKECI